MGNLGPCSGDVSGLGLSLRERRLGGRGRQDCSSPGYLVGELKGIE